MSEVETYRKQSVDDGSLNSATSSGQREPGMSTVYLNGQHSCNTMLESSYSFLDKPAGASITKCYDSMHSAGSNVDNPPGASISINSNSIHPAGSNVSHSTSVMDNLPGASIAINSNSIQPAGSNVGHSTSMMDNPPGASIAINSNSNQPGTRPEPFITGSFSPDTKDAQVKNATISSCEEEQGTSSFFKSFFRCTIL